MILFVFPLSILIAAIAMISLSTVGEDELRQRIGTMQIYKFPAGTFYVSLLPSMFFAITPLWLGHDAIALAVCGCFSLLGLAGAYYTRQYRLIINCHQVTVAGIFKRHFNMSDIAKMDMNDSRYNRGLRIRLYDGRSFFISKSIIEYDALVGILINAVKPVER
ncbi:hypothetical protein [Dyella acidiphila]|uniref:DUF304 domain-containing protein n=1 Tax=Dyella acidiphila TaxID=2775866 RepID=A0ABR9GFS3_9GAMM|nr:hypothetical protein [Dyella acidiphila]MBE1162878.1 hypothetical protein [Dyella acidiphila]